MRDYFKVATVIVHDESLEPGAPRYGAYFETAEEAFSYWKSVQADFGPTWAADLNDFRWIGLNKAGFVATLNSAYNTTFNYQLFINGYDGKSFGNSISIFVESPRKLGFNCFTERPRRR